jgi:7,8-dihydropterin-6-yl-methyl-4-(beta-D-ribofuranosyl)aminobenzene 5'-phosphate synthase
MTLRATVLVENSVYGRPGALAEHGWSVWLETGDGAYLFDTGQGKALLNNADLFGIDLGAARGVLLSHHHYDHTGGLLSALGRMRTALDAPPVPVYAHPDLFKPSYHQAPGHAPRYIGVPHSRQALEGAGAAFDWGRSWRAVAPDLYLSGEVARTTAFEKGDERLRHQGPDGDLVVDPIDDDQTLVAVTPAGLFVILGCAHAGLINILEHALAQTGAERVHTVIGGTHLAPAGDDQVDATIAALRRYDIARLGVSHCTGSRAALRLANAFGDRFSFCSTGSLITL